MTRRSTDLQKDESKDQGNVKAKTNERYQQIEVGNLTPLCMTNPIICWKNQIRTKNQKKLSFHNQGTPPEERYLENSKKKTKTNTCKKDEEVRVEKMTEQKVSCVDPPITI